ncbi:MAG: hypothetical protein IPI39_25035 [Candidatus Obscuribacter sp.]|nr:hypothetical protein [Candidatus Obscuribacter sp.]
MRLSLPPIGDFDSTLADQPLYDLISDFIPLLGYRRKTWLLLLNTR